MATDPRTSGSIRHTLWLYLGAFLALFAVALLFGARDYGQRAANRSYDHLLVSSALSIIDSVALVEAQWQVDLPYAALDLLAMAPEDRVFYRVSDARDATVTGYADLPAPPHPPSDRPQLFDASYSGEQVRFVVVSRRVGLRQDHASGDPWRLHGTDQRTYRHRRQRHATRRQLLFSISSA